MKTFTVNINEAPILEAENKSYNITDLSNPTNLPIMIGDSLGLEPTFIYSTLDTSSFTLGTVEIDTTTNQTVIFTPNGSIGTSYFTYQIEDSLFRIDSANITITTS